MPNPIKNHEGYMDPVPYEVDQKMAKEYERVRRLIRTIRYICDLAGFEIDGRISLVDKETNKIWR